MVFVSKHIVPEGGWCLQRHDTKKNDSSQKGHSFNIPIDNLSEGRLIV